MSQLTLVNWPESRIHQFNINQMCIVKNKNMATILVVQQANNYTWINFTNYILRRQYVETQTILESKLSQFLCHNMKTYCT